MKYELKYVDSWYDGNSCHWNESYQVGNYDTFGNPKRAFLYQLKKMGVVCHRGRCYVSYDGDLLMLRLRSNDKPLFAAVPID